MLLVGDVYDSSGYPGSHVLRREKGCIVNKTELRRSKPPLVL